MPSQHQNKRGTGPADLDDERPTAKRSRVSRACDQCRTAREKCDGTQPTCLTCSACKRACTYTTAPKKRGIQPGYIRTLELALTWLFQQNSENEALLNRKLAQEGTTSVILSRDTRESNRLHRSWRRSKFYRDVDKLLAGEKIGSDDGKSPRSDDGESDVEVEPSCLSNHALTGPHQAVPLDIPNPHDALSVSASLQELGILEKLVPLPQSTWQLLDVYFAYTQSWLPICEKHDILRLSYSYPEEGLALTTKLTSSGDHAELWSILAVASCQTRHEAHEIIPPNPESLYNTARKLIPTELGTFKIGHIKALLNLAVLNIGQARFDAAWLLIGNASRILITLEQSQQIAGPRWRHVLSGCFLLDNLLSMQLCRRPYFRRPDLEKLEEDGLEEWQPWSSPLGSSAAQFSRTPALSLSSFNNLLNLTSLLCRCEEPSGTGLSSQELLGHHETWLGSLPGKLDYLRDERKQTPLNPPAVLLRISHLCLSSIAFHSRPAVHLVIDLGERYQERLGAASLPSVVHCLLGSMQRSSAYRTLDQRARTRFQNLQKHMVQAWSAADREAFADTRAPINALAMPSFGGNSIPTPESLQVPLNSSFTPRNVPIGGHHRTSPSLLDDILPDMNSAASANPHSVGLHDFDYHPLGHEFGRPSLQHRDSTTSRDIQSFFDELAFLDGAEKVENQPQFMQNLGFAPDANMADFLAAELSNVTPMNSTFMPQNSSDPTQLDSAFFDAS